MVSIEKQFEIFVSIDEYRPRRPAPHAQSHDDPGFSDSGDDEHCAFTLFIKSETGVFVQLTDPAIYDVFVETVYELARRNYDGRGKLITN